MSITLTRFEKEPLFDRLPVQLLRCAATVPPRERIFAQGQLCRAADRICVRLWTFETAPAPETRLEALFSSPGGSLTAFAEFSGKTGLLVNGIPDERFTAKFFSGEDLQGVYAGVDLAIEAAAFLSAFKAGPEEPIPDLGVNLLRRGTCLSSLVPEGQFVPLET